MEENKGMARLAPMVTKAVDVMREIGLIIWRALRQMLDAILSALRPLVKGMRRGARHWRRWPRWRMRPAL